MRVAELGNLTIRLNTACGRPIAGYSARAPANIGCIHVRGEQQGAVVRYRLVVVINTAGGVTSLAGPKTAAAMFTYLNHLCIGAELVRALPTKTGVIT
jgi:hypothetical protein